MPIPMPMPQPMPQPTVRPFDPLTDILGMSQMTVSGGQMMTYQQPAYQQPGFQNSGDARVQSIKAVMNGVQQQRTMAAQGMVNGQQMLALPPSTAVPQQQQHMMGGGAGAGAGGGGGLSNVYAQMQAAQMQRNQNAQQQMLQQQQQQQQQYATQNQAAMVKKEKKTASPTSTPCSSQETQSLNVPCVINSYSIDPLGELFLRKAVVGGAKLKQVPTRVSAVVLIVLRLLTFTCVSTLLL